MIAPLSAQRIAALRRPAAQQVSVRVVAETGSTNADLLASLGELTSPVLLAAETQTAGRGRAGRAWHSAPGASLTFSLAWKFNRLAQGLVGLPLAVGVVVAETLKQFGIDVQLKWPNDILKNGKKLCGVLIETASAGHATWAVIGIGLNIAVSETLATMIGRPVAEVPALQFDRDELLAELANGLADAMVMFEQHGFDGFMTRWNALHAYTGRPVVILDHGRALHEGIAAGVDHAGRLLLDTAAGRIAVMVGDVSLRVREN